MNLSGRGEIRHNRQSLPQGISRRAAGIACGMRSRLPHTSAGAATPSEIATVTLQNRENPVVVSQRMGHSSVSITTDIYAHALPGWQQESADSFAQTMDTES